MARLPWNAARSSDAADATSADDRVLERFRPTTGIIPGWAGIAVAAFAVGYCLLYVHTIVGVRVILAALFVGVVVWVSQLRPRATAYVKSLHLKGPLRDAEVPYVLIDEVTMGQTLNVWVGDRRYVCIGIGKSLGSDLRQRAKKERQSSELGRGRLREFIDKAEMAAPDQTAMSYHTFVVTRIEELVEQARRDLKRRGADADGARVSRPYAVPELVALAVTGLAFAVSLLF